MEPKDILATDTLDKDLDLKGLEVNMMLGGNPLELISLIMKQDNIVQLFHMETFNNKVHSSKAHKIRAQKWEGNSVGTREWVHQFNIAAGKKKAEVAWLDQLFMVEDKDNLKAVAHILTFKEQQSQAPMSALFLNKSLGAQWLSKENRKRAQVQDSGSKDHPRWWDLILAEQ